jgi:hypothetical protein
LRFRGRTGSLIQRAFLRNLSKMCVWEAVA